MKFREISGVRIYNFLIVSINIKWILFIGEITNILFGWFSDGGG